MSAVVARGKLITVTRWFAAQRDKSLHNPLINLQQRLFPHLVYVRLIVLVAFPCIAGLIWWC